MRCVYCNACFGDRATFNNKIKYMKVCCEITYSMIANGVFVHTSRYEFAEYDGGR